jgi:hypothetical protein
MAFEAPAGSTRKFRFRMMTRRLITGVVSAYEIPRVGPKMVLSLLQRRVWSNSTNIGCRTDLTVLPEFPSSRIPIAIEQVTCPGFNGFREALAHTRGKDAIDLIWRSRMCDAGVRSLYIGYTEHREPVFAQWMITARDQEALHAYTNRFPRLAEDEALFEGTYTFPRFRGLGVMGEGSRLMFERAIAQGIRFAVGYVGVDNVPQIRAVARTGAIPDRLCVVRWRFGRPRIDRRGLDTGTMAFWDALTTANPADQENPRSTSSAVSGDLKMQPLPPS